MPLLDTLRSPADLKQLKRTDLPRLASEIRATIIDVVSRNGGHLASSLGSVELTIALHYVFDLPTDKIVWDVGHQCYAHKLLTGRQDRFDTLRKKGGLSGFTKVTESPYDAFSTGHSSTSISAGLGMAQAKTLKGDRKKVVAVIGDGSLTAGMAYEGLNQAGDSDTDLIVILNDNDMSIAPNVGALSSFLSRTFSAKYLQDLRAEFGRFLKSVPKIGDDIYQIAKRSEESFKAFVTPGMLFEAFNFDYFGPIDGHRLNHLIDILENIKSLEEPVLLHVTTRKGKGYPPAERNPTKFHGVAPFDIRTGEKLPTQPCPPSYTEIFGKALCRMAREDERIVAITAAMPEGTGLTGFAKEFPKRFFDVGIAEQHGVTFAAGMATEGLKPVVAIYSTFLQRSYDQVIHDVCLEGYPVVFAMDRGGLVGDDGPTHHGVFDYSFLRHIPNITLMAPRDENAFIAMLKTAVAHDGPVGIRYPRGATTGMEINWSPAPVAIGSSEMLRDGSDVAILAIGRPVQDALIAATILAEKGIAATVVDARFVKPLDEKRIREIAKNFNAIVTVEENATAGGFGSAVLECMADQDLLGPKVRRIGIPDRFIEHGTQKELRDICGVTPDGIVDAVQDLLEN